MLAETEFVELQWLVEWLEKVFVLLHAAFGTAGLVIVSLTFAATCTCLICALIAYGRQHRWLRISAITIAVLVGLYLFGRIGYLDQIDRGVP